MSLQFLQRKLCFILLLMSLAVSLGGCDEEESDPLRIEEESTHHIKENVWRTYYPNNNKDCITISGGERPYSVSCQSDILKVNMDKSPNAFNCEVLGVGETEVKISDASGQFIVLKVKIDYYTMNIRISELDACVTGDQMTVAVQKELKEKALASIPVKAGGGYKFVYTREAAGTVYVYPDGAGSEYKEGTFIYTRLKTETASWPMYKIMLEGRERVFIMQTYYPSKTRTEMMVPCGLYEDLLEQYQGEYPEVENVYTIQVLGPVF